MSRGWPLTGRAEELRFATAALGGAGGAGGVVLAGAAGVGKTRLAREIAVAAQRRRYATRWVTASSSAQGLPLGAFAGVWTGVSTDPLRVVRDVMEALLDGGP